MRLTAVGVFLLSLVPGSPAGAANAGVLDALDGYGQFAYSPNNLSVLPMSWWASLPVYVTTASGTSASHCSLQGFGPFETANVGAGTGSWACSGAEFGGGGTLSYARLTPTWTFALQGDAVGTLECILRFHPIDFQSFWLSCGGAEVQLSARTAFEHSV